MAGQEDQSGTASTRDSAVLPYTIHGNAAPGRPRLALVHSLGLNGAAWTAAAERLAATATVLTYDCRGHGNATKGPGPYGLTTFADDLADLLDHLGWRDAIVAGASMGGSVALQFAVRYPDRVTGLGLFDTTASYGPDAQKRWEPRARQAEEQGLASLIEFQETRWFSDAFREAAGPAVTQSRATFLANDVASFAASCRMLADFDLRPQLAALRVPTAVVVGEEDYATPVAMARELHEGIAGSTLSIVPHVRHLAFVEQPDAAADALSDLLSRALSPSS